MADYFEASGLIWTSNTTAHRFNRYLRRLLGLSEEDIELETDALLLVLHPEDRESSLVTGSASGDGGAGLVSEGEIRMLRGGRDTVVFRVVLIRDFLGDSGTVIRVLRNITTEREQLQRLNLAQFALEKGIDPVVWCDESGRIVFANRRFCELVRLPKRAVVGTLLPDHVQFGDLLNWNERIATLEASGARMSLAGVVPIDGSVVPVETAENYLVQGRVIRVTFAFRDLRERKDLESRVEESERLTSSVLDLMPLPVVLVARNDGEILECNNAAAEILGTERSGIKGHRVPEFVAVSAQKSDFLTQLDSGRRVDRFEMQIRTRSGVQWMLVSGRLISRRGADAVLVTFVEVSAHKRLEEELRQLATVDMLTGCLNRRSFQDRGTEETDRARRTGASLTVLLMDLDHFKGVNDTWGHGAGDRVLIRFAETVRQILRTHDTFGRLGGEEFGVLLPGTNSRGAWIVAERIRASVAALDVEYDEQRISTSVSIGIAPVMPEDAAISEAIRRADDALYQAKAAGRNRTQRWKG